ncbi:ABC transporter ATP-binding protein [Bacillus atrophaeus]|uniref:ABC transporter ATP-binding protein n=2 Tax=Bacillus atrophaeus TaxID=1452 RepID=UPI002163C427|nr:ABC transporter ATP-binding protein [Bacillus atrophaeus]MCY8990086.1 ABC transporter ATP-binding protein [Bacillus atrophaeus]MCY9112741.1 ABC transporter ATP-binding protein [Bacillus atrophaeus]
MNNIMEVRDLNKSFTVGKEKIDILKNIQFQIKKGEFVSIMGPSGSGKSTLLYMLGALETPSSGIIRIDDMELHQLNDKKESRLRRRKIGFVFQFYNLVPNLTVEENILLPILLDGKNIKAYKQKLQEILDIVSMTDRKKHTPMELSGGQQQRVAIARALINDPEIILADEPIGNLDSKTGLEIMKLFQYINQQNNKTIIQVTHSLESAAFGNRIINLKDGTILSDVQNDNKQALLQ